MCPFKNAITLTGLPPNKGRATQSAAQTLWSFRTHHRHNNLNKRTKVPLELVNGTPSLRAVMHLPWPLPDPLPSETRNEANILLACIFFSDHQARWYVRAVTDSAPPDDPRNESTSVNRLVLRLFCFISSSFICRFIHSFSY